MAILKMKKLRICGVSEEQTQLIRQLQLLGSVEIGAPCALTDTQVSVQASAAAVNFIMRVTSG